VLSRELRALGHSVDVIDLALNASNHFERFRMYEDLTRGASAAPPGQRWIYLAEVQLGYDRSPVAQLERNHDSARAYYYLSAANAFHAARALRSANIDAVDIRGMDWLLVRHALIHTFNVGLGARLVPAVEAEPPVRPQRSSRRRRGFRFDRTPLLNEARTPGPASPLPEWLFDVRERREKELWSRYGAGWVYFGVPSTAPEQLRHIRSFCAATEELCIAPDLPLLERLGATSWHDAGHMSAVGAKAYSAWLARELDRLQVLQK
jgi:hypothetical protein